MYQEQEEKHVSTSGIKKKGMLYSDFHIPLDISTLEKCIFFTRLRHTQNMKISVFLYLLVLVNEIKTPNSSCILTLLKISVIFLFSNVYKDSILKISI